MSEPVHNSDQERNLMDDIGGADKLIRYFEQSLRPDPLV